MNNPTKRADARLVGRVLRQLESGRELWFSNLSWKLETLTRKVAALARLRTQLEFAYSRQMSTARERVVERVATHVADLIETLQELQLRLQRPASVPAWRDLAGELQQIREEFGGFAYDAREKRLSVITDRVELQGVRLGAFRIELSLESVGRTEPHRGYRVNAVDPSPAAGEPSVTHPHVSDHHLCEGDATLAIKNSLRDGRLADFFILVTRVLNTYNPGSAYVPLDRWSGADCGDCGVTMDDDTECSCDRCGGTFCEDCAYTCTHCDRNVCRGCSEECEECHSRLCTSCLGTCSECGRTLCPDCLDEGTCKSCNQSRKEECHEPKDQTPEAAVHADGVGQTAVPA